jgi:SAM-dependent methyltransferase
MGLNLRALTRLLDAIVTLGLLEKQDARYRLTAAGARLSSRHPETVLPMVLHSNHLWDSWGRLTEVVRRGPGPMQRSATTASPQAQQAFIGAMHAVGVGLAAEIAGAVPLTPFRRLLDIGGASGTYTIAFLRRNPEMAATLFDLEGVIPLARQRLEAVGLLGRVELVAGDFYRDELPSGCDLALLSAIIHQNSPEQNLDLFRKVHRVLDPGGMLLIRDHIMDESRTCPPGGALFAINMLVNTPGGDTYTFDEVKAGLDAAGFSEVALARTGERMDCLIQARKGF